MRAALLCERTFTSWRVMNLKRKIKRLERTVSSFFFKIFISCAEDHQTNLWREIKKLNQSSEELVLEQIYQG
jgi:hypothetical protein